MLSILLRHYAAETALEAAFHRLFDNFLAPEIKERLRIRFASLAIHVPQRRLSSEFTIMLAQDVAAARGIQLANILAESMYAEMMAETKNMADSPPFTGDEWD